ncbi:hypothetical protein V7O62_10175 [Methanolobus sp. ZRKC2]|uniref:hypothetical protein n=1 Tax=Methanolobus sp. ZRKC2 TaxID=3125783 RepID=UPI003253B903
MKNKIILITTILLLCVVITGGCTSAYSDKESFVLEAQTYTFYEFPMLKGEYIDMDIMTHEGPIDAYILDSENLYRYESNLNYFEYDAYYENVLSKNIKFNAPFEGNWYLVLVNNETYDISMDISYEVY